MVLTREEPIEEVSNLIEPFKPIFSSVHADITAKFAFARPARQVIAEHKHPLFSFYNGGVCDFRVELADDLVSSVTEAMGMADMLPGKAGNLAYKMFKKFNLEVENEDIASLSDNLQGTLNSEFINSTFAFWRKVDEMCREIRFNAEYLDAFKGVSGSIKTFFPVSGVATFKMENHASEFWDALSDYLKEKAEEGAADGE